MKKYLLILLGFSIISCSFGQQTGKYNTTDGSTIALSVITPRQTDNIPEGAQQYLENKLKQIASIEGMTLNDNFGRLFLTTQIFMATKDLLPGPPMKVAMNMELTFYMIDYYDQKIFATYTMSIKGVGDNQTKAYINGIKSIAANNPQIVAFIAQGKRNMIDYYNVQCDHIIKRAELLASQKKFERAIFDLMSIPEVSNCYDKAIAANGVIYQKYIDYLCDINLQKAKVVWAAQPNAKGATEAGAYLRYIYPDAACYMEGQALYKEIKSSVTEDWKFEMKKWDDLVDLESQRIAAIKAVGVAYGNGQKPNTILMPWMWK